eukprot:TRINITY_DN260_c1_g1_i1.p2 TRINITY_DN260_c1_g1~~TRINITY_DN260_c1_g1_i1.p2  ORF type:complete len:141 (+),score=29.26 TRINITY_DN260_c1_g1_i1:51-425(+)
MTKFMVALDSSEHAHKAFEIACRISRGKNDTLYLIAVAKKGARAEAEEIVAKYEALAKEANKTAETEIVEGKDPREAICETVDAQKIEVLIVGTRGLGTLKRMFLGSVSNYCVQHAHCDVIVAK